MADDDNNKDKAAAGAGDDADTGGGDDAGKTDDTDDDEVDADADDAIADVPPGAAAEYDSLIPGDLPPQEDLTCRRGCDHRRAHRRRARRSPSGDMPPSGRNLPGGRRPLEKKPKKTR
jgi:hypothetical protein